MSRVNSDPHLILCNNVFCPRIVLICTLSLDERMVTWFAIGSEPATFVEWPGLRSYV